MNAAARLERAMDRWDERARSAQRDDGRRTAVGGFADEEPARMLFAGTDLPVDDLWETAAEMAREQLEQIAAGMVDPAQALMGCYVCGIGVGVLFAQGGDES
jgi:hypothetical protein